MIAAAMIESSTNGVGEEKATLLTVATTTMTRRNGTRSRQRGEPGQRRIGAWTWQGNADGGTRLAGHEDGSRP